MIQNNISRLLGIASLLLSLLSGYVRCAASASVSVSSWHVLQAKAACHDVAPE